MCERNEHCGYPQSGHADFTLNGVCVIDLPDEHLCDRSGCTNPVDPEDGTYCGDTCRLEDRRERGE